MKRVLALILALCMACALFACGKKQTEVAPGGDSPTVTPGATDPGSGPAENPGGSAGVPGGAGSTGNAGNGGNTTGGTGSTGSGWAGTRVAVIYFSCTGNTRTAAERIRDLTGADLIELVPEQPYTSQDLDYNDESCRANQEQHDDLARPAISGSVEDMDGYDVVFIGYPIWWGQTPKIVYTFLESYDFSGKIIVPFCTSGGSGIDGSLSGLQALTPDADWLTGQRFSSGTSAADVQSWADSLGL